jgi:hypothetical protein
MRRREFIGRIPKARGSRSYISVLLAPILLVSATIPSLAQRKLPLPPSSCARLYIGTWTGAWGSTNVRADGTAYPSANAEQDWTCSGNHYTFYVPELGRAVTGTLSADGTTMVTGATVATRVGKPHDHGSPPQSRSGAWDEKVGDPKSRRATKEAKNAPPPSAHQSSPPQQLGSRQTTSCSDITGLGGSPGPTNCTQSNGVPPNVQAQIKQAQSYMQAAKTVKESDTSYNGWSAAAQQFRKAQAAFKAAGDLANATAAAEQAQTLENARKIADQKSVLAASQPPSSQPNVASIDQAAKSCPPLGPASYWQKTPNAAYCANANCVERGSAYYGMMCFPQDGSSQPKPPSQQQQAAVQPQQPQAVGPVIDANSLRAQQGSCSDITGLGGGSSGPANCQSSGGQQGPQQPTLAEGLPSPSAVTPNFSNAILSLVDAVADARDDDLANRLRRRLERTLGDHRVPVKSQDYACLQPASTKGGKPKLVDVRCGGPTASPTAARGKSAAPKNLAGR